MTRLWAAIRANPFIIVSALSGAVTILGALGIFSSRISGVLEGALSVALGIAMAASVTVAQQAIQKRAVARALRQHKEDQ